MVVFNSCSWFQNQVHASTVQTVQTPPRTELCNPNFGPRKDFEIFVSSSGLIIIMLCCSCICWFCRKNPPGIALNFHQVSSWTPEISIQKSCFLAPLCGAETVCLWRTETLCLWGTESLCLWGAETLCPWGIRIENYNWLGIRIETQCSVIYNWLGIRIGLEALRPKGLKAFRPLGL